MFTVIQSTGEMIPAVPLPLAGLVIEVEVSDMYFARCDLGYQSIVDALESIGADPSYGCRKNIESKWDQRLFR